MPVNPTYPGVYLQEQSGPSRWITPASTSITAFIGRAGSGPTNEPVSIYNFGDYVRTFGGLALDCPMSYAVEQFFRCGGSQAVIVRLLEPASTSGINGTYLSPATYIGDQTQRTGIYSLEKAAVFNLLCIPPDRRILPNVPVSLQDLDASVRQAAAMYCTSRRAFYIVDPPVKWTNLAENGQTSQITPDDLGITAQQGGMEITRNAAVYFPRVWAQDMLQNAQLALFAPCGMIAGVIAATDTTRGVWKAPDGIDAGLAGVTKLEVALSDTENGSLNALGINCLRNFPVYGPLIWGARTLCGADQLNDDYKYVNVRRLALFIEQSLFEGTKWAVFEPNNETLWSSLRLMIDNFLGSLQQQGAFYSYFANCDASTTTQTDIDNGIVNIVIGFAPLKPAEFVLVQIQQFAGQTPSPPH